METTESVFTKGVYMFNFNNIGEKIKALAKWSFYIASTVYIIAGLATAINTDILSGCLFIILGPILAWVSSFLIYGFGQLVENSDKIVSIKQQNTKEENSHIVSTKNPDSSKQEGKFLHNYQHNGDWKLEGRYFHDNKKNNDKTTIQEESYYSTQYKTAKQLIKHLSSEELNLLTQNYKNWFESIKKMPLAKMIKIIENEQDSWEKEYIYLCCLEILNRVENNK
jgi:hypothetical protein